ncbi:MAG: SDR family oxidoreductase [Proteobacteria bacterium]|nr:SDR family oxidoreductase [Pseudomonadota bacterium]
MHRFEERVALVTGAASGIGRATAIRIAEERGSVVCVDVQEEAAAATAQQIQAAGGRATAIACDVSDEVAVRSTVRDAVKHFGRLDALCNIAGILRFEHTHEARLEDWNRVLAVNLTGTFLCCREAVPHLLETRGSIVNMSSTAGLGAHAWTAAYSASKGGVLALTHCLAIEYGKQGLNTNAVCPGGVTTPLHDAFSLPEGADPKLLKKVMPFTDFVGPEDVAATVAFLASTDAKHVNGEHVRVDGGMLS